MSCHCACMLLLFDRGIRLRLSTSASQAPASLWWLATRTQRWRSGTWKVIVFAVSDCLKQSYLFSYMKVISGRKPLNRRQEAPGFFFDRQGVCRTVVCLCAWQESWCRRSTRDKWTTPSAACLRADVLLPPQVFDSLSLLCNVVFVGTFLIGSYESGTETAVYQLTRNVGKCIVVGDSCECLILCLAY